MNISEIESYNIADNYMSASRPPVLQHLNVENESIMLCLALLLLQ